MLKIVISFVIGVLFLSGCNGDQKESTQNSTEVYRTVVRQGVNVWCDKEMNTEYLIFKGYKSGGMTVRYERGNLKHCTSQSRRNSI